MMRLEAGLLVGVSGRCLHPPPSSFAGVLSMDSSGGGGLTPRPFLLLVRYMHITTHPSHSSRRSSLGPPMYRQEGVRTRILTLLSGRPLYTYIPVSRMTYRVCRSSCSLIRSTFNWLGHASLALLASARTMDELAHSSTQVRITSFT